MSSSSPRLTALRGHIVTFRDSPFEVPAAESLLQEEDGLVLIEGGKIRAVCPWSDRETVLPPDTQIIDYSGCLISAGFIDTHVHYPQLPVIASWGEQLLEWLERYVFPAEAAFADPDVARATARRFMQEILRAGTTTAAVYCTVHATSADAFFEESTRAGTRMIAGKVLMDRNAPDNLRDTARTGYDESAALIRRWHGNGRQLYAVTPRFAITSTPAQLEAAGALVRETPGVFMQTHLAENTDEVTAVRNLFPESSSYLNVYDSAGLVGARSILAHSIHVGEQDFCRCHETGAAMSHCPTSNLFLGSGAFRLADALRKDRPVRVGLGSDIGAGTSLSQLRTMGEAYKVALMTGNRLHAAQALWLATAGAAHSLHLDDRIGTIAPGMEADLCILDPAATPLLRYRNARCETPEELLFVLMTLGDERCVRATWADGRCVWDRETETFY